MRETSICIIVKNRTDRVRNVLKGLASNTVLPDEVLIVHMNEPVALYDDFSFPVYPLSYHNQHPLPLGAARNHAAEKARFDQLIFLDADCIPSKNLICGYSDVVTHGYLYTGNVRYLPEDFNWQNELDEQAVYHPDRKLDPGAVAHELFWSLNFACTGSTFSEIGGFDEHFTGYGAEDTDFAFSARKRGIPLVAVDADVFHQYHPTYRPPLNHLRSIVDNAQFFFEKWGVWPMQRWLNEFAASGLIRRDSNSIQVIREPKPTEIEAALNTNPAGY